MFESIQHLADMYVVWERVFDGLRQVAERYGRSHRLYPNRIYPRASANDHKADNARPALISAM
jgi:hypothetical protein